MSAPPPPPPHGDSPKSSGLPDGKYDIFIIPPHSAGSGFLYLPSLRPNVNSFAAGFASALLVVVIGQAVTPAFQAWWHSVKGAGGMGMMLVIVAVALGAWALGRTQTDGGPETGSKTPPQPPPHNGVPPHTGVPPQNGVPPQGGAYQGGQQHQSNGYTNGPGPTPGGNTGPPPKTWQRANPAPGATPTGANTANGAAKGAWEKAREETKRKEDERKAKEAERKRKEELEKRLKEARERDAREREAREKVVREREALAKEKLQKDNLQKEVERLQREKLQREKELKDNKENKESEVKSKGSTYAYSAVGEKTNPWPRGQPAAARPQPSSQPSSPTKRPPAPSARTYLGTEDDQYSFRPYDKPKKPAHSKSPSSVFSESSYAASHSTYATTAPASNREPYTTKDPDKIVIKAVYSFNNAFIKTPTSQLVSGVGSVTDGLILRITTEGLFIDDDVRGVPQREWDVKAWTMKLVETGELKSARLHILRASIRDQDGKRYVFVIQEEESWKVAVGLQRLRKGTQVRALGVSGMSSADARNTLENLGWG